MTANVGDRAMDARCDPLRPWKSLPQPSAVATTAHRRSGSPYIRACLPTLDRRSPQATTLLGQGHVLENSPPVASRIMRVSEASR